MSFRRLGSAACVETSAPSTTSSRPRRRALRYRLGRGSGGGVAQLLPRGAVLGGLGDLGRIAQLRVVLLPLHARDDEPLHLGRALEDLVDLGVAEPLLERALRGLRV